MNKKPIVLIVDDEKDTLEYLKILLGKFDYHLRTASSGKEAVAALSDHDAADLILLDIMMPGMDGFEVLRFIKNHPPTRHSRVIMLTALDQIEDKIRAFDEGAADYVSKPFNIAELQARIKTQIELKLVEEELRESEHRFRTMLDFTYDWEYWLNPKGELIYTSPSCERITGYSADELKASPGIITDMLHPDDRDRVMKYYAKKLKKSDIQKLTFRIIDRQGDVHWIGYQCRGVYSNGEGYLGRRVSNRDITAQKQSEEAYHTLVENSIQELLIFQDGKIVFANPAAAEMSDFTREELVAMTSDEITNQMHQEDREAFGELIQKRLSGRLAPARFEFRSYRKDGSLRWVEMMATFIMYKGKPAIQVAQIDISDRKSADQAVKRSEMLYKATINTLEDSIFVLDKEMKLVLYNRAFTHWCRQQSVQVDNIIGESYFDIFPFLHEQSMGEFEQVLETGKQITKVETIEMDGKDIVVTTRIVPIFVENQVAYLVSVIHEGCLGNHEESEKIM